MLGFVGFPHAYKQDSHSCWMYVKSNYALLLQLNATMRPLPRFSFLVYNEFRTHIRSSSIYTIFLHCAQPGVRGPRAQPMRAARGTWATRADDARSQGYEPFYRAFQVKKYTAVFGPLGLVWPSGGPSGCSVCARADARYRETPRTPSSQNSFLQVPFVPAFTVWNMFSG